METDRGVRRLTTLEQSASSARVLSLLAIHRKSPDDSSLQSNPLFRSRILNRSIILKHRLRQNELGAFSKPRPIATKIMIPIDGADLRAGAQSFFVDQVGYDSILKEGFGDDLRPGSHDRQLLELIDGLPSLDPFLLREYLRHNGFEPARGYFSISEADAQRMSAFARQEIMPLVVLSTGNALGAQQAAGRMVEKLLANTADSGFEPLKHTLGLSEDKYQDGVFAWRGFIYYKWVFTELSQALDVCVAQMKGVRPHQPTAAEVQLIESAKLRILAKLRGAHARIQSLLEVYNSAYSQLTTKSNPAEFRDFLAAGPDMFVLIGEQLGAIQHVISFWSYRMPREAARRVNADELSDLFLDFEDSLSNVSAPAPNSSVA